MKKVVRFGIIYLILFIVSIMLLDPYGSPDNFASFKHYDWFMLILSCLFVLDFFCLWVYFLYDWGNRSFINKRIKKIWFLTILIGSLIYFIGIFSYYITVIEFEKGVRDSVQ